MTENAPDWQAIAARLADALRGVASDTRPSAWRQAEADEALAAYDEAALIDGPEGSNG